MFAAVPSLAAAAAESASFLADPTEAVRVLENLLSYWRVLLQYPESLAGHLALFHA